MRLSRPVGAVLAGSTVYIVIQTGLVDIGIAPVILALAASALAMFIGGTFGSLESDEMLERIGALHG